MTSQSCRHQHGDFIKDIGNWVCGQCYKPLHARPTTYGKGSGKAPEGRQEIVWQAEIKHPSGGVTLSVFISAMVRVFIAKDRSLSKYDAAKLALAAIEQLGTEYGSDDYEWTRVAAIDMADEEICYWEEGANQ